MKIPTTEEMISKKELYYQSWTKVVDDIGKMQNINWSVNSVFVDDIEYHLDKLMKFCNAEALVSLGEAEFLRRESK